MPSPVTILNQDIHYNGNVIINNGDSSSTTFNTCNISNTVINVEVQELVQKLERFGIHELQIEQEQFLEEYLQKATTLNGFNPSFLQSLPKIETVLNSVCLMRWREVQNGKVEEYTGTAFLAKIPGIGIAFISAGHNF